jgi:hypothetical protein
MTWHRRPVAWSAQHPASHLVPIIPQDDLPWISADPIPGYAVISEAEAMVWRILIAIRDERRRHDGHIVSDHAPERDADLTLGKQEIQLLGHWAVHCILHDPHSTTRCDVCHARTAPEDIRMIDVQTDTLWRVALTCQACEERLDADMWISDACLERVSSRTPVHLLIPLLW